jgi:hypothetical protein
MNLNMPSEQHELFADVSDDLVGNDLKDVEADCLAEGPALTDDDDVTLRDCKRWRNVHWDVHVTLLVTVVLRVVVHVISAHNDGSLHLGRDNYGLENTTANGHLACERTLVVDVVSFNGLLRRPEAETNTSKVTRTGLGLLGDQLLAVQEHVLLLLIGSFVLNYSIAYLNIGHCFNHKMIYIFNILNII